MQPDLFVTGRLLVSSASLWDPNFRRTVVYILEHDEEGALGLVLNDPLDLPARGLIPEWDDVIAPPEVVFRGGPVQVESAVGLARAVDHDEPILVDLSAPPPDDLVVRIFAGYSGWGPQQLEGELAEEAWHVVPARSSDVLTPDPEVLWEQVVERLPGDGRILRTMPTNPTLN